jgi:hypothetical protein
MRSVGETNNSRQRIMVQPNRVKEVLQHQVKGETAQENRGAEFLHPDCGPQPELYENCAPRA